MSIPLERAMASASKAPPSNAPLSETARGSAAPTPFGEVFRNLASRIDHGEALVARALRGGGGLDPSQWIALQAGIYRYVEAVDLAGKVVDRAGTAIRTVLQAGH